MLVATLLAGVATAAGADGDGPVFERQLRRDWLIRAAAEVREDGEALSSPGPFSGNGWVSAEVPSTVLGALVDAGVYGDILSGTNLAAVSTAPFSGPWWYRTEFELPPSGPSARTRLAFDGVNYRADVWLNGRQVAAAEEIFGPYRRFELDVSRALRVGVKNVLAVRVFPPKRGEPSIGFVDWNPAPPDASMGLWRGVRILRSGPVSIHHPLVRCVVDTETLKAAELTVSALLRNEGDSEVTGELVAELGGTSLSKPVRLKAGQAMIVDFGPEDYPQLRWKDPLLWWPHDLGEPALHALELRFSAGGVLSDRRGLRFGIRQVSDYLDERGHRGYRINGQRILVRGAGWTDDIFLRQSPGRVRAQVRYAKHMGLNALRLESFWGEDEELYDACDEEGILLMAGWSCQWEWSDYLGKETDAEHGGIRSDDDARLIGRSWRDQLEWLRGHPSIFVWLYGSDMTPSLRLEREYQSILHDVDPDRPFLAAASWRTSALTGPTGVKMNGPYDYVPPAYWFVDRSSGGAFGFNTETGPGPQVPVLPSLARMLAREDPWPMDDTWTFHCAMKDFRNLDAFNEALAARFGKPRDARDYERKAQLLNYDGMRAMFEAFGANKFAATGVVQWMFNSAWPKLWWQLFDYYLVPTGAFYGVRKANGPLHAVYDPSDRGVHLVNHGLAPWAGLSVELTALDIRSMVRSSQRARADIGPNQALRLPGLGVVEPPSGTYFVDLRVKDARGALLDANLYALSAAPDMLDAAASTWVRTPVKAHADLTALAGLAPVKLEVSRRYGDEAGGRFVEVRLANPTKTVAFSIELLLMRPDGRTPVAPVFCDDGYFSLLPGESRTVRCRFAAKDGGAEPELRLGGWNIR